MLQLGTVLVLQYPAQLLLASLTARHSAGGGKSAVAAADAPPGGDDADAGAGHPAVSWWSSHCGCLAAAAAVPLVTFAMGGGERVFDAGDASANAADAAGGPSWGWILTLGAAMAAANTASKVGFVSQGMLFNEIADPRAGGTYVAALQTCAPRCLCPRPL